MIKNIGAQLFTVRDYCKTIEDFESTCKKLSDIGYKMIQISRVGPDDGKLLKEVADKYGLDITLTHCADDKYRNELDWIIKYHKDMDCEFAGLGMFPNLGSISEETLIQFLKDYEPIIKKLKENGITFSYHNHAVEFRKIGDKHLMDIIMENTDPEDFKITLDVYWATYAGINPAKFIRENPNRIACIHFKDYVVMSNKEIRMGKVGYGNLDWDDIIKACEESGVKYAYVEQDDCYEEDPFDCLKLSYDFLTKKGFC